jgi:hypothetical protein
MEHLAVTVLLELSKLVVVDMEIVSALPHPNVRVQVLVVLDMSPVDPVVVVAAEVQETTMQN